MLSGSVLSPLEVYQRGLRDPEALTGEERLVYLLIELETYADMEGWDHFFTTPLMRFYEELKGGLQAAGDLRSAGVLNRYEEFLRSHGVALEPDAIEEFCGAADTDGGDWHEEYSRLNEARWERIREWLRSRGITLAD